MPASQVTASAFHSSPVSHGELDAEVAQRLRQLSKKDASTKVKALQVGTTLLTPLISEAMINLWHSNNMSHIRHMWSDLFLEQALKVLLGERPAEEIEGILLAWTKPFQRLVMDNDRCGNLRRKIAVCGARKEAS